MPPADAAGDVTTDYRVVDGTARERVHDWDALQRYTRTNVVSGTTTDYYYTPSGRLSRVTAPGELPSTSDDLYIGDWARLDMTTGAWTDQVNANSTLVMELTGPRFEMPHRTVQETVAAVSDDQGTVVRQEEFAPYGARTAGTPAGRFEQHFQGIRGDEVMVAGGRAYDPEAGRWLARDFIHRDPRKVLDDPRLASGYAFDFSNPYAFRDPTGLDPAPEGKSEDTQVMYIRPKDVKRTDKKNNEYRWSISGEQQRKEYEAALGKFLHAKGIVRKDAKIGFQQLDAIRDVSKLASKDATSLVLVVHGFDKPEIGTRLANKAAGLPADHIDAGEFAKLISGTSYVSITILGCDAVSNQFSPNLAAELPAGGSVTGFKGDILDIQGHREPSKTQPGTLVLKYLFTRTPLETKRFSTGGKP
jgi:RHS repeat-associated protein